MNYQQFKIYYWPGFTSGLFFFTIVLTYFISVYNGHVYSFFPYISDSGALPPESCIFGQLMNLQALAMGITLYIRYRQVESDTHSGALNVPKKWNRFTFWCIPIICLGISIVANVQETSILVVHLFGAGMCFYTGTAYFFVQTRISFATRNSSLDHRISKRMLYLRVFLSFSMLPLILLNGLCGVIATGQFKGKILTWWTEEDGGFELRLISSFSEWFMTISMYVYLSTFTNEFKSITFEETVFSSKSNNLKNKLEEMV